MKNLGGSGTSDLPRLIESLIVLETTNFLMAHLTRLLEP